MGQIDFNKLWANFMDLVQNHYMDFSGRLGRAQYWYFILICFLVLIAAGIVNGFLNLMFYTDLVVVIVNLALLLPIGAASARRIQDSGNNGQLAWIFVIVVAVATLRDMFGLFYYGIFYFIGRLIELAAAVASLAILYYCIQPGTAGDNQYGPPPPPWSPGA